MTGHRHRQIAPPHDLVQQPVSIAGAARRAGSWLAIALIRFYQLVLSPIFPASCRYTPTCSQYALEAVRKYGALKGAWIGLRRVLRCHPFHPGGYDPVP